MAHAYVPALKNWLHDKGVKNSYDSMVCTERIISNEIMAHVSSFVTLHFNFPEICNSKFDWDEVLTGEIKRKWDKWVQDLAETKEICRNRVLFTWVRQCQQESLLCHGLLRVPHKGW